MTKTQTRTTQTWGSIDLQRAVLVEIDVQGWIVAIAHDAAAVDKAAAVRRAMPHQPRICVRYLDLEPGPRADPHTIEASFDPRRSPASGDTVVTKHGKDAFESPEFSPTLAALHVTTVVLTGLLTEHGVATTAHSARARGYEVVVVADACADITAHAHERALADLAAAGIATTAIAEHRPR